MFLAFGALFGFLLSRARASDFAAIAGMFRLTDLHLFGVIGVAIATAALGLAALRASQARALDGAAIVLKTKPYTRAVFAGGLIFGVGWALSGACPGTALTQIGEGKLYALATVAGIVAGTWWQQRTSASPRPVAPLSPAAK
jgi:uncharacterized membrane protein YedE/YeeE